MNLNNRYVHAEAKPSVHNLVSPYTPIVQAEAKPSIHNLVTPSVINLVSPLNPPYVQAEAKSMEQSPYRSMELPAIDYIPQYPIVDYIPQNPIIDYIPMGTPLQIGNSLHSSMHVTPKHEPSRSHLSMNDSSVVSITPPEKSKASIIDLVTPDNSMNVSPGKAYDYVPDNYPSNIHHEIPTPQRVYQIEDKIITPENHEHTIIDTPKSTPHKDLHTSTGTLEDTSEYGTPKKEETPLSTPNKELFSPDTIAKSSPAPETIGGYTLTQFRQSKMTKAKVLDMLRKTIPDYQNDESATKEQLIHSLFLVTGRIDSYSPPDSPSVKFNVPENVIHLNNIKKGGGNSNNNVPSDITYSQVQAKKSNPFIAANDQLRGSMEDVVDGD